MNPEIAESFRWWKKIVQMVVCSWAGKVSVDLSERPVCREHTVDIVVEDTVEHLVPSLDSEQATEGIAGPAVHTATADQLAALDSCSHTAVLYLLAALEVLELLRDYSTDSRRCYQRVNTLRHSRWG